MEVYPKLPLFCGTFVEVYYSYLAEKVEVLWKFCGCEISIKNCDSNIWKNTLWLNTILFAVCRSLLFWVLHQSWICTDVDCFFACQNLFSDMMIVGNIFMWSLIDKHLKSWQFAFLPTSTGFSQTLLFLNLYFPTSFCENPCGVWLTNILGLDSFLHSLPVDLHHKHDGLIVDQYLFSDRILEW